MSFPRITINGRDYIRADLVEEILKSAKTSLGFADALSENLEESSLPQAGMFLVPLSVLRNHLRESIRAVEEVTA